METSAPNFVPVGALDEFPTGAARAVEIGQRTLAVFHCAGELFALDDMCPHSGGPLSEGELRDGRVVCPWHGAEFELSSGRSVGGLTCRTARTHAVRVREGRVEVQEPS